MIRHNNTAKYVAYGWYEGVTCTRTLHKPHTLLSYYVWSLIMPVGLIFTIFSPFLELCTTTAVHHQLAQGWANAYKTKVDDCFTFLAMEGIVRRYMQSSIIDDFQTCVWMVVVAQRRDGGTSYLRYLVHWHPATVCCNKHHFSGFSCAVLMSDYSWWPIIDFLLYFSPTRVGGGKVNTCGGKVILCIEKRKITLTWLQWQKVAKG